MRGILSKKNLMATTFEIEVYSPQHSTSVLKRITESAFHLAEKIEFELSEFIPDSPIFLFNQSELNQKIVFPDHTRKCFFLSKKVAEESKLAFQPSFRSSGNILDISYENTFFWKTKSSCSLSFGAIGKGYALDQMKLFLLQHGIQNFRVSSGGSSHLFYGWKEGKKSWPLSWSWMKTEKNEYYGMELEPFFEKLSFSVGVSGDLEKGDHISTSYLKKLRSVWVEHPSAAMSDAWSTAFFSCPDLIHSTSFSCSWIDQNQFFFANQKFLETWGQKRE